jgi:competence protein ComEC
VTVRFYDVGQALAALVELPDGRRVLVDTGENPKRSKGQCHDACEGWHQHLMDGLRRDLAGHPIDLLWITHQHSDHLGGAIDVLSAFEVKHFVDNGTEGDKPEVAKVHDAAESRGTKVHVVDPAHRDVPLASTDAVKLTAVVPNRFPYACTSQHVNDCSIALRVDVCETSVLFVGDAEEREEAMLETRPVTLLQVGHHGSETSTTKAFLERVRPKYAVVSAGKRDEGTNESYCHPRASTVAHLTAALGGSTQQQVLAFDSENGAVKCKPENGAHWVMVPASDRLFFTERDGDVVLRSNGDGLFSR